jgi:threonine aldolase
LTSSKLQNDGVIDFRSDTLTQPTRAMREAIANAAVGDEQKREDPTVNELERRGAEFLGHEEAVFLPTATMANQIALQILGRPGDALLVERHAHIMLSELGGPAAHSGLLTISLEGTKGRFSPDQVVSEIRDRTSVHVAPTRIVTVENTHNSSGGRVWPLDEIDAIVATCREHDLAVHLDGARLVNAAIACGVDTARIGGSFDTVTLCFSKGLGCPLGALIAGSTELMQAARRGKHFFGGAMRQAGIVAAAALYSLDHHVSRIADDHRRARRLAEQLVDAGVKVDLDQVETNFVQIDVGPLGLARADALARLRAVGIGLSATIHPTVMRAVVHLGIGDEDIERALVLIPDALAVPAVSGRRG